MSAPDLTEARDLAAIWQARAEAAEREAAFLLADITLRIGTREEMERVRRGIANARRGKP